jgi:homoserine dehydrogenase
MRPTGNDTGALTASFLQEWRGATMKLSVIADEIGIRDERAPPAAAPLVVLKFGSSVLRTVADLPAAAGEVRRLRDQGYAIVAVVSALAGETDALFAQGAEAAGGATWTGIAELVSLGEERTAALLAIACARLGVPAAICRAEALGLVTHGDERDADFAGLRPSALLGKLDACGVVIVPGFVGVGEAGTRTLLGRGGSDFTAAILGGELGAESVRLYKDVDGVFEADPARDPAARKLAEVDYAEALRVAGPLVHDKAVRFAAARGLPIEVGVIGSAYPTRIVARRHDPS